MPTNAFVFPFNIGYVKEDGAGSLEEFRDWVSKYGEDFYYGNGAAQKGIVIVFAWIAEAGKWFVVGDAIVKSNHLAGSEDWCSCEKQKNKALRFHIMTGGVRLYPNSLDTDKLRLKKRNFIALKDSEYLKILSATVANW